MRDKLGPDVGETPLLMLPGFEFVFLSSWRTVSRDSEGASPKATALSASNRNVQRSRPAGAGLQVTAMRWAAPLPVSRGGAPVRGRSVRAPMLSSTKRWRVRSTVTRLVATSSAISSSLSPSSAFNKIRARVICRAAVLPERMRPNRVSRSWAVKSTRYFFAGIGSPSVLERSLLFTRSNPIHQNFLD